MYIQAKKLDMRSQRLGVATATTQHTGLYATDEKTSTKFLVDTGACVSIISASRTQQQFRDIKTSTMLTAANETSIPAGVTMTLFCTHGRVSGPSSLLDLEVMAPRGYSVPCQF